MLNELDRIWIEGEIKRQLDKELGNCDYPADVSESPEQKPEDEENLFEAEEDVYTAENLLQQLRCILTEEQLQEIGKAFREDLRPRIKEEDFRAIASKMIETLRAGDPFGDHLWENQDSWVEALKLGLEEVGLISSRSRV